LPLNKHDGGCIFNHLRDEEIVTGWPKICEHHGISAKRTRIFDQSPPKVIRTYLEISRISALLVAHLAPLNHASYDFKVAIPRDAPMLRRQVILLIKLAERYSRQFRPADSAQ
jgi:hypothetical protein